MTGKLKINPKIRESVIIFLAVLLFFGIILICYAKKDSKVPSEHCSYDSYTLAAMAWRRGEIKLDQNYPYLELAIINRPWLEAHDKNDYMAYRETFGDINAPIEDVEDNEYYVSFPPTPTVPMYLLTFIYGENTPSNMVSILYAVLSYLFAILLARRLGYSLAESVTGALFVVMGSSAFFLCVNKMAGGVWFMAQNLSLLLTILSFWFIQGKKDIDGIFAMICLALAVGCRPFQIVYFFYFAYVLAKKYDFKILKTWKYYIAPAIIGGLYMIYNYVRFGSVFEFGHNFLPEFMRKPEGQFSLKSLLPNLREVLTNIPKLTENGIEFSMFGFAFYIANVIFMVMPFAFVMYFSLKKPVTQCAGGNITGTVSFREKLLSSETPEILLLLFLNAAHFVSLLMHSSLGGWQFGSRYTVDMIPAAFLMLLLLGRRICSTRRGKTVFFVISSMILIFGIYFNIYGALKLM